MPATSQKIRNLSLEQEQIRFKSAEDLFQEFYRLVPYLTYKITKNSTLITHSDQEDIISKTYLSLWEICLTKDVYSEIGFKAYVIIRIKGSIIDEIRKKQRCYNQALQYLNILIDSCHSSSTPESFLHNQTLAKTLELSLAKLNPREALIIRHVYIHGQKFCDLSSQIEGLSKSWISKLHKRAITKLRKSLLPVMPML